MVSLRLLAYMSRHLASNASILVASCLSYVPEKGTVGASGDLAPLSHLALGLMGEGQMWSPETGWAPAEQVWSTMHSVSIKVFIMKHFCYRSCAGIT